MKRTCSECDSEVLESGYCMMGHWMGKQPVQVTVNVEFIRLARSMRLKQREFFTYKGKKLLVESKQLERQFDAMLRSILDVMEQFEKEQSAIEAQRRLL